MNPSRTLLVSLLASAGVFVAAQAAHAQPAHSAAGRAQPEEPAPARDEPAARRLRAEAASARAAGQLERAFEAYRRAAPLTGDPTAWRDLAEVADHLRMNEVALEAYRRYLAARPHASDAAEIGGRVRVLGLIETGVRFVASDGAVTVDAAPEAPTRPSPAQSDVLVDWQGRPVSRRPSSELLTLAEWDNPRVERAYPMPRELMPFPGPGPSGGIGRRLARP